MLLSGVSNMSVNTIHSLVSDQLVATGDGFVLPAVTLRAGDSRSIDVELRSTEHDYTALQCQVVLPQGLTLTAVEGIDRGAGHSFYMSASQVEDNVYTIMATAMDLATFEGVEGNVMRLTVTASDNFTAQGSELTLANVVLVTDESQELLADDAMARISETSGIDDITATRQIDTIRYINVAGQESDMPFDGVNIVVTTYTDGTSTTVKVIK